MYERSYGYRYSDLADTSAAGIAKAIRADIKTAVTEGLLPERWKYSVRSDSFSGGRSVSVEVRDCADAYRECDGVGCRNVWCAARNDPAYAHGASPHDVLTDEGEAARMTLERIHGAYNHDGSESMVDYFDVRYYGGVSFEDARSAEFRAAESARLAAKKAARVGGEIVGKVANYSRDARSKVVHVVVRTAEGKDVLGCGARTRWNGFPADDGDEVTCSRCARREAAS